MKKRTSIKRHKNATVLLSCIYIINFFALCGYLLNSRKTLEAKDNDSTIRCN